MGRGRPIIGLGAIVILAGALPPWTALGGTVFPTETTNAFEGSGILVFVAAVALLAVLVLPYATREGKSRLDRPPTYVLLAAIAVGGLLWRLYEMRAALGLPDRVPGAWISGAGVAIVVWGVAELLAEPVSEG
jgi:hypothetical protein